MFRVTDLCEGNSPVTGEFPEQMARNAENVSIWYVIMICVQGSNWQSDSIGPGYGLVPNRLPAITHDDPIHWRIYIYMHPPAWEC